MTAARAFARSKPIVAYKAGRFPESARAAASHTGALASEDAVYDAAFERAGIARVFEIGDIFNCAELVGAPPRPRRARGSAIVTNAGGPGVMATDALIARRGVLAELSPATLAALDEALPPAWSHGNPVDVLGDANSKRYAKAAAAGARRPGRGRGARDPHAAGDDQPDRDREGARASWPAQARKPLLAAWLGGSSMREGAPDPHAARASPPTRRRSEAVQAFMTLVAYARNLEIALRDAARRSRSSSRSTARELQPRFAALMPGRGRHALGGRVEGAAGGLRHPGDAAACRPRRADEAVRVAGRRSATRWCSSSSRPTSPTRATSAAWRSTWPTTAAVRAAFERIVAGARRERGPGARVERRHRAARWCASATAHRADPRRQDRTRSSAR